MTWLEPLPDALVEPAAPREGEPESALLTRETIELSFLAVIQLLTPQQRAALILRDVLGWSAKETAGLLEVSPTAVDGALQRARATLREHFPSRRPEWPAGVDASTAERHLLARNVAAAEEANFAELESLIREDATCRMPPQPEVWVGREAMIRAWVEGGFGSESFGRLRCVTTRANRQPAVACWVRRAGDADWRALAVDVLRIEDGRVAEIPISGATHQSEEPPISGAAHQSEEQVRSWRLQGSADQFRLLKAWGAVFATSQIGPWSRSRLGPSRAAFC